MAFETPLLDLAFKANADLSSLQYCFVKVTANSTVGTTSGTADNILGVLQNKPGSLQAAAVRIFGVSKLVAGAAMGAGSFVTTDAAAHGIAIGTGDTTRYTVGIVVDDAAAASEIASVLLTHAGRGA